MVLLDTKLKFREHIRNNNTKKHATNRITYLLTLEKSKILSTSMIES